MKGRKKAVSILMILGVFLFLLSGWAAGQEKFPTRPISLIIPWAPGGGGTLSAQTLQPHIEKAIGVGAVIVNKTGGGGTIAWNFVANATPDGYTVGIVNPSLVVTLYTTKTGVSYKKFDPIIYTVGVPAGVVVKEDSPWKTFKEFIDHAKANPGKVQMANSGHGAMYHIGIVGIEMATGVKFTNIPYKGSGPCVTALLGGHADGSLIEISTLLPYVEAKKFRILAVSSAKRNFALPDVPTFKEYGFDLDVGTWYGYVVPKGTPKDRIKGLHDAFKVAMESEEFKAFYKKQGGVVEYMGPEGLAAYLEQQDKLWKKIIDFGGFKPME
ncbi:MAG: tripartite tricarboxylate transporter substrate binding protein [Deltaproteobacteria bacterium]|nr:tripartite tricarboxylate transporter substrate binding protein [Deltaproteobacteria bacterium]